MSRNYSRIDRVIASFDEALRMSTGGAPAPERASPAGDLPAAALTRDERRHVAGLMRINHTGEVCALLARLVPEYERPPQRPEKSMGRPRAAS